MDAGNYIKGLEKHVDELKEARDEWKKAFESLFNEVNEHGVCSDILKNYVGESDNLDELKEL